MLNKDVINGREGFNICFCSHLNSYHLQLATPQWADRFRKEQRPIFEFFSFYFFGHVLEVPKIYLFASTEAVYYFVNLYLMLTSLESNAGLMPLVKDKGEDE